MQAPVPPSLPAARLSARAGTDGNDEVGQETQYRQALYLLPIIPITIGTGKGCPARPVRRALLPIAIGTALNCIACIV